MKSTRNSLWAYAKSAAVAVTMVTGTAILMGMMYGPPDRLVIPNGLTALDSAMSESGKTCTSIGSAGWVIVNLTKNSDFPDQDTNALGETAQNSSASSCVPTHVEQAPQTHDALFWRAA